MHLRLGEAIRLETKAGQLDVRFVQFGSKEGVCLTGPDVDEQKPVPVRGQSSCLFGESFWATDCDCANQLRAALEIISKEGGLLIYLYEEGRGAGLERKIEAIRLQQQSGLTTSEAYECMGLEPDLRSYEAVAEVVKAILPEGREVSLLTNNPRKEALIRKAGINVVERRPLVCGMDNPETRAYLIEKVRTLGHEIDIE